MEKLMWNLNCIQNFINNLEENSIPKAILVRLKSGYSNKRIVEDFKAIMIKVEVVFKENKLFFVAPYCNLALNIGIAHGLVLYKVVYPETGYFANPENTLDKAYAQLQKEKLL